MHDLTVKNVSVDFHVIGKRYGRETIALFYMIETLRDESPEVYGAVERAWKDAVTSLSVENKLTEASRYMPEFNQLPGSVSELLRIVKKWRETYANHTKSDADILIALVGALSLVWTVTEGKETEFLK